MEIKFTVKKILYPYDGIIKVGGFSIISCAPLAEYTGKVKTNTYGTFTLNCYNSPSFNYVETYTAEIESFEHEKYGLSYKVISMDMDNFELDDYSKDLFLRQTLTPKQYSDLTFYFNNPFEVIAEENIDKLCECKGIGRVVAKRLIDKYHQNYKYAKLLTELKEYGLSVKMMDKLLQTYLNSETVIKKIKENPYILANDVNGIGFKKADAIALNGGMSPCSVLRLKAFMEFFLETQAQNGNSWVAPSVFAGSIEENLNTYFTNEAIVKTMYELFEDKIIVWNVEKTKIALAKYYNLENNIAKELTRINNSPVTLIREFEKEKEIIKNTEKELGFEFTEEQIEATSKMLDNQVSLLIAKSGSGKTTLIKLLTRLLNNYDKTVRIATLSGKASARIEEATGYSGSTIHRLLKYNAELEEFTYNKTNLMPYDAVIIDESSFLGGELFYSLVQAIQSGCKLVLVGDDKQIPAIGVSNVFFDIINSKKFNVNVLTRIHRQALKSGIITEADKIREGVQITKNGWYGAETRGELQDFIIDVYKDRCIGNLKIMEYYKKFCKNLEDTKDTIVVLPMKNRGEVNTYDVNELIQKEYNPPHNSKREYKITKNGKEIIFRVGDRVLNCVNDYKANIYDPDYDEFSDEEPQTTELFNGFCGVITDIIGKKVIVKYDLIEKPIEMNSETIRNLDLGYAITVHKMQGSEVKNVIMLIDYTSYIMNCRELIYTGVTRAKKQCVLLAESGALIDAIKKTQTINKQTFLLDILQNNLTMA